jgi:hypothetical protein
MPKNSPKDRSVKSLAGILYKPNRRPVTIEEMNEAAMRAASRGNVPNSALGKDSNKLKLKGD